MREENGRFLREVNPHRVTFSNDILSIDQQPVIRKTEGLYVIQAEDELLQSSHNLRISTSARRQLEEIAELLNEGQKAEAIFKVSAISWPKPGDASKWQFNPQQPATITADGRTVILQASGHRL